MIIDIYRKHKLFFWIIVIILLVLVVLYILYITYIFQIRSIFPPNNTVLSGGSVSITFTYNKDLESIQGNQVFSTSNIIKGVRVDKNKLIVNVTNMNQNSRYSIFLKNIQSKDGQIIEFFEYKFINKYIPYNQQSREIKEEQVERTDRNNIDDPVVKLLPKVSNTFNIKYEVFDQPNQKGKYVKLIIALLLSNYEQNDLVKMAEYKKQALDFLKSNGINPDDYVIDWYPPKAANL